MWSSGEYGHNEWISTTSWGLYNIAINGCIDGFSHYVVRMEASRMNYDPKVTADPMGAWEDVQIFPDFFLVLPDFFLCSILWAPLLCFLPLFVFG